MPEILKKEETDSKVIGYNNVYRRLRDKKMHHYKIEISTCYTIILITMNIINMIRNTKISPSEYARFELLGSIMCLSVVGHHEK
jgi:hypothetical protein